MKVLLGTIVAGPWKDYAVAKFTEMYNVLLRDVDVLAVVDEPGRTSLPELVVPATGGTMWATEIVYYGKAHLRDYALANDYDALIWQGIDCYYDSRTDFDLLVKGAEDHAIIGGLIAARNRPGYAVCRRFISGTTRQADHVEADWPQAFQGVRDVAGYIGSDATLIRRDALETVTMDGYEHWHLNRTPGRLGPEEFFMWSAINRDHIIPAIDARVRPWHAHETGLCARYPNQTRRLEDLGWPDSRLSELHQPRSDRYVPQP